MNGDILLVIAAGIAGTAAIAIFGVAKASFIRRHPRQRRSVDKAAEIGLANLPKPANDRGRVGFRRIGLCLAAGLFAGLCLNPESGRAQQANPAQPVQLPPLKVEGTTPSCVDVQVEGARSISYDCLNKALKDSATGADAGPHPFDAKDAVGNGAPNQVGTFSYTGTSIRMGNAFGHSAIPQRPAPPSFTNVLLPAGGK